MVISMGQPVFKLKNFFNLLIFLIIKSGVYLLAKEVTNVPQQEQKSREYFNHNFSITIAEAPPPPLQIAARPMLLLLASSTECKVVIILAPEQPKGWPNATAPPHTFSRSMDRPSFC